MTTKNNHRVIIKTEIFKNNYSYKRFPWTTKEIAEERRGAVAEFVESEKCQVYVEMRD